MGGAQSVPLRKSSRRSSPDSPKKRTSLASSNASRSSRGSIRASLSLQRLNLASRRSSSTNASSESEQAVASVAAELGETGSMYAAPNRRLLVMGSHGSGKSTLIRQMKATYDGLTPAEAGLYAKEVLKAALQAFKQPLSGLEADQDVQSVMGMNIRDLKKDSCVRQLHAVLKDQRVLAVVQSTLDVRSRLAFTYYASRLEELTMPSFVPDKDDLLHLNVPTVGSQETRLETSPVGPLSLVELGVDLKSSIFNQPVRPHYEELFQSGVEAIVFVASAAEAELIQRRRLLGDPQAQSRAGALACLADEDTASVHAPTGAIELWHQVLALSEKHGVPIFLVFSQIDLLQRAPLPDGMHFHKAKNQLLAEMAAVVASRGESKVNLGAPPSTLNLHDGDSTSHAMDGILDVLFPDDVDLGKAMDLCEGVYLGLAFFDAQGRLLMQGRSLPLASVPEVQALCLKDYTWLQHLPRPLVNPNTAGAVDAAAMALMERGVGEALARGFWGAAHRLGGAIGQHHLGTLHASPILVAPGTLLLLLCARVEHPEELGTKLRWKKLTHAADRMAKKMFGAELRRIPKDRPNSYALELAKLHKGTDGGDKLEHPSKWLGKLRLTAEVVQHEEGCGTTTEALAGLRHLSLSPGTYVCAFYLLNRIDGLQVLTPDDTDPCLPPMVQISSEVMSVDNWKQLQQMAVEMRTNKTFTIVTDDWAKARAWMGPAVGQEDQFTAVQKFFYGVLSLRQRLQRRCTAVNDELRTSKSKDAVASLTSLGTLYTDEIICLDRSQQVQIIVVGHKWNLTCPDAFDGMRWYPVELFEARHYKMTLRTVAEQYDKVRLLLCALEAEAGRMEQDHLRESHLSNKSSDSNGSATNSLGQTRTSQVHMVHLEERKRQLEDIYEPLRWTKRVTLWMMQTSQSFIVNNGVSRKSFQTEYQTHWAQLHNTNCNEVQRRLDAVITDLSKEVEAAMAGTPAVELES